MNLIIINGPPGAGKSTVAESIHKTLSPLAFLLKLDAQRRFINKRHEYRQESNSLTYKVAESIIETCLKEGRDVVLEKVITEPAVIDKFIEIGKKYDSSVFEFILWADKETIVQRNAIREAPADGLPDTIMVSPERAEEFWNKVDEFKHLRTNAIVIDVRENNLEQVIDKVQSVIQT